MASWEQLEEAFEKWSKKQVCLYKTDLFGISEGICVSSENPVTLYVMMVCFSEYAEDYAQLKLLSYWNRKVKHLFILMKKLYIETASPSLKQELDKC